MPIKNHGKSIQNEYSIGHWNRNKGEITTTKPNENIQIIEKKKNIKNFAQNYKSHYKTTHCH